jgi:hypothetical protein
MNWILEKSQSFSLEFTTQGKTWPKLCRELTKTYFSSYKNEPALLVQEESFVLKAVTGLFHTMIK